jgi:hypothetical protein
MRRRMDRLAARIALLIAAVMLLAACVVPGSGPGEPVLPIPEIPQIPGLPRDLAELPNVLRDLGLPDLSGISGLPGVELLPQLSSPPGSLVFRGPYEQRLAPGERIPGTDIELVSVGDNQAEFRIAGMRSERILGDSLDYDGEWLGGNFGTYNARFRLYLISSDSVRIAGVHQLEVRNVQPVQADVSVDGSMLRFPYTVGTSVGGTIPGTTFGYAGLDDRGANISGLPQGDYPYRKTGDSIQWSGYLRGGEVPVEYTLRVLYYGAENLQVGGIAYLAIPD